MVEQLSELLGTSWAGECEVWLDPLGDEVQKGKCSLNIVDGRISYSWERDGSEERGTLTVGDDEVIFTDTFHSPEAMTCRSLADARGLLQFEGTYGPSEDWGWRIALVYRAPMDNLVLQMTNIAPWGEEARAVRMTLKQQ